VANPLPSRHCSAGRVENIVGEAVDCSSQLALSELQAAKPGRLELQRLLRRHPTDEGHGVAPSLRAFAVCDASMPCSRKSMAARRQKSGEHDDRTGRLPDTALITCARSAIDYRAGHRALRRRLLNVALEHGGADFGTVWPLSAPAPGMGLVMIEVVGVGLHYFTGFEKQQAEFVGWHSRHERFGFVQGRAQPARYIFWVERLSALETLPLRGRVVGIAPDFGDQALRREGG